MKNYEIHNFYFNLIKYYDYLLVFLKKNLFYSLYNILIEFKIEIFFIFGKKF